MNYLNAVMSAKSLGFIGHAATAAAGGAVFGALGAAALKTADKVGTTADAKVRDWSDAYVRPAMDKCYVGFAANWTKTAYSYANSNPLTRAIHRAGGAGWMEGIKAGATIGAMAGLTIFGLAKVPYMKQLAEYSPLQYNSAVLKNLKALAGY